MIDLNTHTDIAFCFHGQEPSSSSNRPSPNDERGTLDHVNSNSESTAR